MFDEQDKGNNALAHGHVSRRYKDKFTCGGLGRHHFQNVAERLAKRSAVIDADKPTVRCSGVLCLLLDQQREIVFLRERNCLAFARIEVIRLTPFGIYGLLHVRQIGNSITGRPPHCRTDPLPIPEGLLEERERCRRAGE